MKDRIFCKKTIFRIIITAYVVISLLALGFIGESNYRSNLIKFGYDLGNQKTAEEIVAQIESNPCEEILIHIQQKSISLIDSTCLK